jgi:hypothetical protein
LLLIDWLLPAWSVIPKPWLLTDEVLAAWSVIPGSLLLIDEVLAAAEITAVEEALVVTA